MQLAKEQHSLVEQLVSELQLLQTERFKLE